MGSPVIRGSKDAKDLVLRENVWADGRRAAVETGPGLVGTGGFSPAPVKAEVVDDPHPVPSHAGSQGFMGVHPIRKRVLAEVCGGFGCPGQIPVEVVQDSALTPYFRPSDFWSSRYRPRMGPGMEVNPASPLMIASVSAKAGRHPVDPRRRGEYRRTCSPHCDVRECPRFLSGKLPAAAGGSQVSGAGSGVPGKEYPDLLAAPKLGRPH